MSCTSLKEFRNLPFKIATFYLRSFEIISHRLVNRMRSMGKLCLDILDTGGDLIFAPSLLRHNQLGMTVISNRHS